MKQENICIKIHVPIFVLSFFLTVQCCTFISKNKHMNCRLVKVGFIWCVTSKCRNPSVYGDVFV